MFIYLIRVISVHSYPIKDVYIRWYFVQHQTFFYDITQIERNKGGIYRDAILSRL
jgi:hypothetical protein